MNLLLLAVFACGEDEPLPPPTLTPPIVAGGVCQTTNEHCIDDARVLVCEQRVWTELSCSAVCAERGRLAEGCRDAQSRDSCICSGPDAGADAAAPSCGSTLRRCVDSETLLHCRFDGGANVQRSCSTVCAELSPPRSSLGCQSGLLPGSLRVDDCVCSRLDTPCANDPTPICDGTRYVARCVDGLWQIDDCALVCGPDRDARCSAWLENGGAGCLCDG